MNQNFQFLPIAASSGAVRTDTLFLCVLAITGGMAVLLATLMVVFAIRYRKGSSADRSHAPANNRILEIAWTVFPLLVFLGMFVWAAIDYLNLSQAPQNATPVFVVAKQWMWTLEHDNGRREINELHVPLGQPVRLVMTSQDVIHSFFVPAFRIKQDVLPGRYTSLWFKPTVAGEYHLLCAEYCGTDHSAMGGRIVVMAPADYARWLAQGDAQPQPSIAARGFALFGRFGCSGCHAAGSSVHAPDLNGLLGRAVHLQDGRTVLADENYIRDAILLPDKDIVAGYAPIMPSFTGQLGEEDINAIIEYLRTTGSRDAERK
jgi:cytochrome c oxidase subunit 2